MPGLGSDPAELDERAARVRRRGRIVRTVGRVGVAAVLVGAVAAVVAVLADDRAAVARATELPIPPVDEPLGTFLADGTPVWTTQDDDGAVHVLSAWYPDPESRDWGVTWCPSSGMFESALGSAFGLDGRRRTSGPAPVGLARYQVEVVDEATVRVPEQEPAAGDPERGPLPRWPGEWCDGGRSSVSHPAHDDGAGG